MGCGSSQAVSVANSNENRPTLGSKEGDALLINSLTVDQEKKVVKEIKQTRKEGFDQRPALETRPSSFMPLVPLSAAPSYQGTIVEPFDSGKSSQVDFKSGFDLDKVSRCSSMFSDGDSGYLDKEYKNVITEKSDMKEIEKVEKDFQERNKKIDLGVSGVACPPLLTDKEKEQRTQVEDPKSQEILKNSGLKLQRPVTAKGKYATFDIVEAQVKTNLNQSQKIKLPRILREKMEKPTLTNDDIESKLQKANIRKKQQTDLKLNNLRASMDKRVNFNSNVADNESNNSNKKYSQDIIDRQNKLRELREHLRVKKEKEEEMNSARTPRTNVLVNELEQFRPKTPAAFRPEF